MAKRGRRRRYRRAYQQIELTGEEIEKIAGGLSKLPSTIAFDEPEVVDKYKPRIFGAISERLFGRKRRR